MRIWDTFVVDTNNFAQAALYAADNDIEVVEGASGGLFNSRFARKAFEYAYREGVFFTIVSSDLNTADHNIPTLYDEAMQVQGTVADVQGLGQNPPPGVHRLLQQPRHPARHERPDRDLVPQLRHDAVRRARAHRDAGRDRLGGDRPGLRRGRAREVVRAPGGHRAGAERDQAADHARPPSTSSSRTRPGSACPTRPIPAGTSTSATACPTSGLALERIDQGKIPPQALITSPEWFEPLNVNQQEIVDIQARLSADRAAGYTYRLQWAPGIEPAEARLPRGERADPDVAATTARSGVIDLTAIRAALDALPTGGATVDPTAPAKGPGDKDPNEPAFTVRVVVTDTAGNRAEDRKVLFAYRDATLHQGWSKDLGTGGEASPRLFDIDGDNKLDTVLADSSGELRVLHADGTPLSSFNNGQPVRTRLYPNVHPGAQSYGVGRPAARGAAHPRDRRHRRRHGARDRGLGRRARLRLEDRRLDRARLPGAARSVALAACRTARARTTSSAASPPRPRSAT